MVIKPMLYTIYFVYQLVNWTLEVVWSAHYQDIFYKLAMMAGQNLWYSYFILR